MSAPEQVRSIDAEDLKANGYSNGHSTESGSFTSATDTQTPPPVKKPYVEKDALDDLPGISYALELFLASQMLESEEYCDKTDPEK
jgi:hypothetical protein